MEITYRTILYFQLMQKCGAQKDLITFPTTFILTLMLYARLMLETPRKVQRDKLQREQANQLNAEELRSPGCEKLWFECAFKVLQLNNIDRSAFASAMRDCLPLGRAKHWHAILVGFTNCAKDLFNQTFENHLSRKAIRKSFLR